MKILIFGRVQGVGFRPTVFKLATELGCRGFIRNNGSNVEIVVSENGNELLNRILSALPPLAEVQRVEIREEPMEDETRFDGFRILESSNNGARESYVPPDVAVCDECLAEMFDTSSRRYLYPFTNCTNCGARFSVILNVPFDRSRTAMDPFKLCDSCANEYRTPNDRRFHAQTISCAADGPSFTLYDERAIKLESKDPIADFAALIDAGKLGVMKSWGGMHICCTLTQIPRLRDWYRRPAKPFAVMVRDIEAAKRYGFITESALKLLRSSARPIVLVKKNRSGSIPEQVLDQIAPNLDNIGLYLPYTGIQHVLFHHIKADALVMTSANPKGMPMIIDDAKAFELKLDCYLFNDRKIINRIDDSLVIPHGERNYFIRRSRGYVPIPFKFDHDRVILSLGAERNVTAAVSNRGRLNVTQYIGDSNYYDVMLYLDSAVEHMKNLFDVKELDAIAVDMHPQYATSRRGKALARELGCELVEVQHHHAHAAALMLDNDLKPPFVAITIDGTGYGTDGTSWGGEVLKVLDGGEFERVARLELTPLLGGDLAVKEIRRLRFAVVQKTGVPSVELYPKETKSVLMKMMDTSPVSSSLGRTLDALASILDICEIQTYDGEPAMRLEPYLSTAPDVLDLVKAETKIVLQDPKIIETTPLFRHLLLDIGKLGGKLTRAHKTVLASEFVFVVCRELAKCAVECAEELKVTRIGVTGGVAYNLPIMDMFKLHLQRRGMELLTHDRIPCGDGGISIGQNIIANEKLKN